MELDEQRLSAVKGRRIGETIAGKELGLPGYELKLTGGSNRDGTPMRRDVHGSARLRALLRRRTQGYRQREKGVVRRKLVRGNVVAEDIVQLNAVVVKRGKRSLEKLLSSSEEGAA